MTFSQQHTRAIVCQIRQIGRFTAANNVDRLPIRAALRDLLVELEPRREPLKIIRARQDGIGGAA